MDDDLERRRLQDESDLRWTALDVHADHFRTLTEVVLANMANPDLPGFSELQDFKASMGENGMGNIANAFLMRLKHAEKRILELEGEKDS